MNAPVNHRLLWSPQEGPQNALVNCPVREVLFGGARGGGKTDGVLGRVFFRRRLLRGSYNGVFFRQEMPQTDDLIERARELYDPVGARYNKVNHTFRFPDGGRLRFRPLDSVQMARKYQGQNLNDVMIEEAGNYPDPKPLDMLFGALRGQQTQLVMTANPGGPGQGWIKERFIDPAPGGMTIIPVRLPNGAVHERVFIPSRVRDNRILLEVDPDYVNRLYLVGSAALVRAWLDGDWNAIEGAFFDCWKQDMILRPFTVPASWVRFRSMDWGSASPASIGWWAVVEDDFLTPCGSLLPRGALVRYREWYLRDPNETNRGLKLTAEQVATGIKAREDEDERPKYTALDPSAFAEDGGPSIAERMEREYPQLALTRADNKRVGNGRGAMGGWDQMRGRMIGNDDGRPMIYCFDTCVDSIRTIPILKHDEKRPEDLDTHMEDHAADDWRYACTSRPHEPKPRSSAQAEPATSKSDDFRPRTKTFTELVKANAAKRKRYR